MIRRRQRALFVIAALSVSLLLSASASAERSRARRVRQRLGRATLAKARRFETALRGQLELAAKPGQALPQGIRSQSDWRYIAEHGVKALDALRQGQPADPYLHRATEKLGLDKGALDALLAREYNKNRQKRAEHVLRQALPARGLVDIKSAAAIDAAYTVKLWRHYGDAPKAKRAERTLRHLARQAGLDAGKLLGVDVDVQRGSWGGSVYSFAPHDANRAKTSERPVTDRKAHGNPQWWTGAQPTYLDLVHRRLPELLRARFAKHRGKGAATFRVLNVGFEDGSQTLLLASAIDATVKRLSRSEPKMADFLRQLKVEIVATDAMQKLDRKGRTLRFGRTEVEQQVKSGVLVQEHGRGEPRVADKEIAAIERAVRGEKLPLAAHRDLMKKLASAGQVGRLLSSMLTLAPKVDVVASGNRAGVQMRYRIKDRSWRIEDRIAGETINPRAGSRRVMRFEHADITKPLPRDQRGMDLVVCTNVVPYIALYAKGKAGRDDAGTNAAANNLRAAVRKGGALIVDGWSTGTVISGVQPTYLADMWKSGRKVWVSDHTGTMDPLGKPASDGASKR